MIETNRRKFMKGVGGALALPMLDLQLYATQAKLTPPIRFLVVGNPFGAHPEHFFPKDFGKNFMMSPTLQPLAWLKDRMTIVSRTDHNMVMDMGARFPSCGVLPTDAQAFPEKNLSLDQLIARRIGSEVRFDSVGAALESGIRMSWTANGVEKRPFTDPQKLFDHLFLNLTSKEKAARRELLKRNGSILDTIGDQFKGLVKIAGANDRDRLDQFQTSVRELETTLANRNGWLDRDKPSYEITGYFKNGDATIENRYDAIFDMLAYAFQTDLTRVVVEFPASLKYTEIDVNRSYHGCTHNGKREDVTAELVAIETFQIARLSRCLKKLDACRNPAGRAVCWTIPSSSSKRYGLWRYALQPKPAYTCCWRRLPSPWPHRRRRPQW